MRNCLFPGNSRVNHWMPDSLRQTTLTEDYKRMKICIPECQSIFKAFLPMLFASMAIIFANSALASDFSATSPTFNPATPLPKVHVFNGFGCSGENRSPALNWRDAPSGTKSFAITLYDPDAPTGSGWWHWVVYDIPASVQYLPEDAGNMTSQHLPKDAIQGRTDYGSPGYGGICPPKGSSPHRYILTVHALRVEKLPVPTGATAAMVGFMINANELSSAVIEIAYSR